MPFSYLKYSYVIAFIQLGFTKKNIYRTICFNVVFCFLKFEMAHDFLFTNFTSASFSSTYCTYPATDASTSKHYITTLFSLSFYKFLSQNLYMY